jgi:hypothetical protein
VLAAGPASLDLMICCEATTPRGACRAPALSASTPPRCFAHALDELTAARRLAARSRGGRVRASQEQREAAQRRRREQEAREVERSRRQLQEQHQGTGVALGELETSGDCVRALRDLAQAVASGKLDPRRGRVAVDAVRGVARAIEAAGGTLGPTGSGPPPGTRRMTADELAEWARSGQPPRGVAIHVPAGWHEPFVSDMADASARGQIVHSGNGGMPSPKID